MPPLLWWPHRCGLPSVRRSGQRSNLPLRSHVHSVHAPLVSSQSAMLRTSGYPFKLGLSSCRRSTSCSNCLSFPPWTCHCPFPTDWRLGAWTSIHHEEYHVPAAIVQRMLAEPQEMGSLALLRFGRSPDSVASLCAPDPVGSSSAHLLSSVSICASDPSSPEDLSVSRKPKPRTNTCALVLRHVCVDVEPLHYGVFH